MSNSIDNSMDRSLVRFFAGIRTEQTRKDYKRYLGYFLKFGIIKEAGDLLQLENNPLQQMVEDYIIQLKAKGLSKSYIDAQIAGLELFFAMNDKILNFKKIRKMTPSRKKTKGERPYTTEEIKQMLEFTTSSRNKAVIHLFASTGCRVGAIPSLRLQDISDMPDGCKSITFYRGETEEYTGFLTPEANHALELYLQKRRSDGELLVPNSPVFREAYKIGSGKVKPMTLKAIRNMIAELVIKLHGRVGKNNHRDTAMTHAFRKRFNTILKNNKETNIAIAEKLMGHATKLIPLDTVYHTPTREVLFGEFRKAIPDLTIDGSERDKIRIQNLEQEKSELEKNRRKIENMERRIEEMEIGAEGRAKAFAKNMLHYTLEDNPGGQALSIISHFFFEMLGNEEEKRSILKRLKKAQENGEKIDLASLVDMEKISLGNIPSQIRL